jgi:hypothetical protein
MTIFNPHFIRLRLRNSSPGEIFYRISQIGTIIFLKWATKLGLCFSKTPNIDKDQIKNLIMPDLIPESEIKSHNDLHSINVDHLFQPQPSDPVAAETDIRIRWEPARLQQSLALLVYAYQNYDTAGREKAKQASKDTILSWLMANPFPLGEHYQSAMECALRVPVFFYALKRLNNLTSEEYDQILKAIYQHGWLVSKKLSLYSSVGNHTIAEAVGLVFAGAVYRSTRYGKNWLGTGIKLLNDELVHQILEDGGPAEQSLGYHRFVLDLYWLAMDFIQKNNFGNVHHWQTRLTAGEFFLGAFKDQRLFLPAIGDSDDGHAVAPGIAPIRIAGAECSKNLINFAETGYTIIRNDNLVFTFDHGSLGMAPLYNHGHADALSITLAKNGHPLLVDPGTYRYNGVPQWRRYFKGTRAHNTITIDDQDQAVYETGFIWSKPYRAELTATESEKNKRFFSAVHNGYTRLKDPVYHYRSILFFDEANFLIRDSFSGSGMHKFQINYHLHPDVTIDQAGKWWVLENHGESIFLKPGDGFLKPVKGTQNPIMGWFSSRYGEKEPTTVLIWKKRGIANEVSFVTAIFTRSPFNHQTRKKAEKLEREIKDS